MTDFLYTTLSVADWLCFVVLTLCVSYLLFYAIASCFYRSKQYAHTEQWKRFAILFPAYRADKVITETIHNFLRQDYPSTYYDVVVIADQMEADTCHQLRAMGAQVIEANYEESSKAKALTLAMKSINPATYDYVAILDADNLVDPDFLSKVNRVTATGIRAIQAHRTAKNLDTAIALLDAASEEINNGIFRKGHIAAGLSCALIGSGMVFDAQWFALHVTQLRTAGEDKELEVLLQRERIYVEYLPDVHVYDAKTAKTSAIRQQRRRWMATQFGSLRAVLPDLPRTIRSRNWSYADKIVQWMLPPRMIQLAAVFGLTVFITLIALFAGELPGIALKWWLLSVAQVVAILLPLPRSLMNKKMLKAILHLPVLAAGMVANLFHLKGANKKFIHTEH